MLVKINGVIKKMASPSRISELFDNSDKTVLAARVNNRLRELTYILDEDAEIELLDLKDPSVTKIYQDTLRFIITMACKNIFPQAQIRFNYSVSRSIFASVHNLGHSFLQKDLDLIKVEVNRLISLDLPIRRKSMPKLDAINYYEKHDFKDKVSILKYRKEDNVHMYECSSYNNYMFGYMLPSTGYIKEFDLRLYSPGFLITYPRSECGGKTPDFNDERVFRGALKEANNWSQTVKSEYISQMNEIVEQNKALEFINICEARHNRQLAELGAKIAKNIDNIRLICVAGPSSSGKTTFTNRLKIELKSYGIEPLMISMDDFYNSVDMAPKDKDGKPDLEHIEALNLNLFDEVIFKLIQGEEVELPQFDFNSKKRSFRKAIKIASNQPILIEGIHGLNDKIAPSIAEDSKFKIYIAPLAQYKIDNHNPISISDIRLIRRIVRDYEFRNTSCEETLGMWQSVRNGEFKWIYPYQNNADYVFNSELSYELCVMKKHIVPLLSEIDANSPHYITANRLLKFMKYFLDISDKWIPCNSILREFIGESIFYTSDTK